MIKIIMNVRNRFEITKKAIEAIQKYTKLDYQLYIYNNLTSYRLKDHFEYMYKLFNSGIATQVTFNSKESTFNSFSKAVASNSFGRLHNDDPKKNKYEFIVMLDNDIIVQENWDYIISRAWQDVKEKGINKIKIISQHPGGAIDCRKLDIQIAGYEAVVGKFGGSYFWCVKPNFYEDVGYLDIKPLVGLTKKHDQNYWPKLQKASNSNEYLLTIKANIILDAGNLVGSICNVIGYGNQSAMNLEKIKYKETDEMIRKISLEELCGQLRNGA